MIKVGINSILFGYCKMSVPYDRCTDLLNLCMRYGFVYSEFSVKGDTAFFICSLAVARKLSSACMAYKIPVNVESSHGLLCLLYRYRSRIGLLVGGIVALTIIILSRSVVWEINITGNESIPEAEIISELERSGLRIGEKLSDIDVDSVENKVLINTDKISWISVNISGTVANVQIREVIDTKMNDAPKDPANIISRCDAEIVSIEAYTGSPCVKSGDYVRAGDLLVSGLYETTQKPYRYTRASARIMAKTVHKFSVEIPLEKEVKVYSNNTKEKKTLNFFGKSIKLFSNYRNEGVSCDIINYEYRLDVFGFGKLPVSISVEKEFPYALESKTIDAEYAAELAFYELQMMMDREIPDAQLLKKSITTECFDDRYVLECTVYCIEDIAMISEFDIK